jgi:hypothetical protein
MPRARRNLKLPSHRPLIPIDWNIVDKYLIAECTGTEVAAALGMHPQTLYERCQQEKGMAFSHYSAEKKAHGDLLIRGKQLDTALKGNVTMQIWLGKQRLSQREATGYLVDEKTMADLKLFAAAMKEARREEPQDKASSHTESQAEAKQAQVTSAAT